MQWENEVQHVFLVGAKSLGAYGGYETFVYKLTEYHQNLRLCKLDSFDGETLQEKEIGTYSVSDMTINSKRNYRRVHTLNKMGSLEVIDSLYYQFNPTILLEKAKRAIKK